MRRIEAAKREIAMIKDVDFVCNYMGIGQAHRKWIIQGMKKKQAAFSAPYKLYIHYLKVCSGIGVYGL